VTLHPAVLADLLAQEADVAQQRHERLATFEAVGSYVDVRFQAQERQWTLRLAGDDYDRLPLSVSFVDPAGQPLPLEQWPPGVPHSVHPVLHRPWICLRGTLEYHQWPGHTSDSWDMSRSDLRLADVAGHILERAQAVRC